MATFDAGGTGVRFGAVVCAGPGMGEAAADAIEAAGGVVWARIAVDASELAALLQPDVRVIAVHLAEGDPGDLEGVATLAAARGVPLVIGLEDALIDTVFAAVGATEAQLLVSPTDVDWVAAIALAVAGGGGPSGSVREGGDEAERLARLNEEIVRIAQRLAALGRSGGGSGGGAAEPRPSFGAMPPSVAITPRAVRDVIRARRLRDRFLGAGLFEDPAWDMLLDLFAARLEDRRVSVSSLCIAAAVAPTTALRWINKLLGAGLFDREPDPADRRRAFIGLSVAAEEGMRRYLAALSDAGLGLV